MELKQHLIPKLKHLRLSGILDTLDVRSQQALAEHWTYAEFLERLLEDEVERREQKQLALRVRRADLTSGKTLETFDFTFNPGINRQRVYDLGTCQFVHEKRNVLLCGPHRRRGSRSDTLPSRPERVRAAGNRDGHRSPSSALRFHPATGEYADQRNWKLYHRWTGDERTVRTQRPTAQTEPLELFPICLSIRSAQRTW